MESTLFEIPSLSVENWKLQTICISWWLGSLLESNCIPNQPVKGCSQLICVLTEYEREGSLPDSLFGWFVCCKASNVPPVVVIVARDSAKSAFGKDVPFSLECGEMLCRSLKPAPAIPKFIRISLPHDSCTSFRYLRFQITSPALRRGPVDASVVGAQNDSIKRWWLSCSHSCCRRTCSGSRSRCGS